MAKKVVISVEYLDYTDIFSKKSAIELLKHFDINKHSINLEPNKQPPYNPIYSLKLVELETLKTYIEIHLKIRFIWPYKSSTNASILFDKKSDGSILLYVN